MDFPVRYVSHNQMVYIYIVGGWIQCWTWPWQSASKVIVFCISLLNIFIAVHGRAYEQAHSHATNLFLQDMCVSGCPLASFKHIGKMVT